MTIYYRSCREKGCSPGAERGKTMAADPRGLSMSVEEYLELDRNSLDTRYEYIDGYVYMLAGGSADHSTIRINVLTVLHRLLHSSSCRVYNSDLRVRLSKKRFVYPDVTVSCDPRHRGKIDIVEYPRLIVEVLSPSTEGYDRGRKFSYYRACPVLQEYVLIDVHRQAVEVFRRETENLWTLHPFGPGDTIELTSIGVSFLIDAVYETEGYYSFIVRTRTALSTPLLAPSNYPIPTAKWLRGACLLSPRR